MAAMDHERPGRYGAGYRLAAPALRARRRFGAATSSLTLAADFPTGDWGHPSAPDGPDGDEADMWLHSMRAFARHRWQDFAPVLRNGVIIGAMGAAGFGMALYASQPGLMRKVDKLVLAALTQTPDTPASTQPAPPVPATPVLASAAPAASIAAPALHSPAMSPPGPVPLNAIPEMRAADATPSPPDEAQPPAPRGLAPHPPEVAPSPGVVRVSPAMAAMPAHAGSAHIQLAPAVAAHSRAPSPRPLPRVVRLAAFKLGTNPRHSAAAAAFALPDWVTHPRPAPPRVLIMSDKPHNLVAREELARASPRTQDYARQPAGTAGTRQDGPVLPALRQPYRAASPYGGYSPGPSIPPPAGYGYGP